MIDNYDDEIKNWYNKNTNDYKEIEEAEHLIGYAVKNGFIDDSAEDWTDEEKIDYANKCYAYEPDI